MDTLVIQLKAGDGNAFRILVDQYGGKVFNTALNMIQDHGMAEDITQDVFVTIFKTILSFNQRSSLSTWIYKITVNKCLDHIRSQKRLKRFGFITGLLSSETGEPVYAASVFDHPGILLEHKEEAKVLFAAVNELPGNQKTVFILAHIEELPQREIAEIMNISLKAVESLLQRAKVNLRKKLEHIYDRRKTD